MINRTKLFLMVCVNLLICIVCNAQKEFDDVVNIKQVNSKYPNLNIKTYDELYSFGHSHLYMQHFGGTNTNPLATPSNRMLGTIIYAGYDGEENVQVGRISVTTSGDFSLGNHPAKMNFQLGGSATCCGINRMTIDGVTGNVGIGTTNPSSNLEIKTETPTAGLYEIQKWTNTHHSGYNLSLKTNWDIHGINYSFVQKYNDTDYNLLSFFKGNIGIGTTNPGDWKLAVNGKIRAKEIKVETGWADFVFYDDYELPTLEEVEIHIEENGHLKDIPTAEEVEENGILVGEMNAKLLQKIEELTLYTIEQQKLLKDLQLRLEQVEAKK